MKSIILVVGVAAAMFVAMFLSVSDDPDSPSGLLVFDMPRREVPRLASFLALPIMLYFIGVLRSTSRQLNNGAEPTGTWAILAPGKLHLLLWIGCSFSIPAIYGFGYMFAILIGSESVAVPPLVILAALTTCSIFAFIAGDEIRKFVSAERDA